MSDIPFLRLYHTLVEDGICSAFGKAYQAKSCEELDGRNTSFFQDFYELPMPCEMAMSKYDPPAKNLKAAAKHICVEIAPFGMWNEVRSSLLIDSVD